MSNINLDNLKKNSKEILKAEVGTLLFNLGKTHAGIGNWRKYFDIKDEQFEKKYGYKPFSGYRDYFKESNFNSKSPFTIDMDSINGDLKKFFYDTDINFEIEINDEDKKQINLKLIDVVKGDAGDSNFIKKIMFQGCENINSGIDKGAPKKQLNNLYIANAFGAAKEKITKSLIRYDDSRIIFFMNLWKKIDSMRRVNIDVSKMRNFIFEEVEKWYSHLLSDSRFPINDVTLWDQVYMTASMFKASIAAMCLEGKKYKDYYEDYKDSSKDPRNIRWSILGVQYDKLGLAEKALKLSFIDWYRDKTDMVNKAVKEVIEENYVLGNEVYRDETGIYFIVPENICGKKTDGDRLYRIHDDLSEIQEKIIECFKHLNGEVFPSIHITEPSRGIMNIAYLLDKAKENFLKPVFPKSSDLTKEYFQETEEDHKFKVICDICKVRLADNEKNEDLNLCSICRKRKKEKERPKLNEEYKETIWTGELQDKNGRIALVTMKFELAEWLNGNMLNTMLISDYNMEQILCELICDLKKKENVTNSVLINIIDNRNLPSKKVNITLNKYAESILLERSIGDRWEKLLKYNLNDKIDFENKEIKWEKLDKKQIEFLSEILLQFVTRKNPSPARFRRIWETTKEFFIDIENNMMDILEIPKWRNVRIKWNKTIKEDKLKEREFEYRGLNFMSDEDSLYLISSIEKAIPILRKEKVEIDKAYDEILSGKTKWIKNRIKIGGGELKLNNPKYISYKPYLSIIEPTPISWQFIIPAEYVPKLIEKVQHKYDEEFKYVKGKLPLHIGVVFQNYKKPLYIGIKALRNIRRDIEGWDCIKKEISGKELKQLLDKAINNSNSGCEDRTELKRHYSLYPLAGSSKGDYNFYINPSEESVEIKSAVTAEDGEKYSVYQNTVDFEYLDVNTRRNDIYYEGSSRSKYIAEYKRNRPYTWEEWESFYEFYEYFKDKERKTKLQTIVNLIYSKLNDWPSDDSLKRFMLSAFINTFKLDDDESKNEFAKTFGLSAWSEIESLNHMEFKQKLCKFLDMYDFWHNGLKEI